MGYRGKHENKKPRKDLEKIKLIAQIVAAITTIILNLIRIFRS